MSKLRAGPASQMIFFNFSATSVARFDYSRDDSSLFRADYSQHWYRTILNAGGRGLTQRSCSSLTGGLGSRPARDVIRSRVVQFEPLYQLGFVKHLSTSNRRSASTPDVARRHR